MVMIENRKFKDNHIEQIKEVLNNTELSQEWGRVSFERGAKYLSFNVLDQKFK